MCVKSHVLKAKAVTTLRLLDIQKALSISRTAYQVVGIQCKLGVKRNKSQNRNSVTTNIVMQIYQMGKIISVFFYFSRKINLLILISQTSVLTRDQSNLDSCWKKH